MAHYLMTVVSEARQRGTAEESAAIDVFNEQLQTDGHWVFAAGLSALRSATVVDARDGQPVFTDGPYAETKEWAAGLWIVEAPDLDVALRLAAGGSQACNRKIELRPLLSE